MTDWKERIKTIPSDGWWKSSSNEKFEELYVKLIGKGFTQDEAIEILETAYCAVSAEFGA